MKRVGESVSVRRQLGSHEVPVNEIVYKCLFVGLAQILVVEVVRMLPHVHGKQGHRSRLGQRIVGTNGLGNFQSDGRPHEPRPIEKFRPVKS